MDSDLTSYLFTQGVLGVVVIVESVVIVYQQKKLDKEAADKAALQEARRVDYATTLSDVTKVLSDNSQNSRILSEKIEAGKAARRSR